MQWDVEKLPNGRYKLQNRGAAVGTVDGHLFAFLIEAETLLATLEWTIQRDAHDPDGNSYVYVQHYTVRSTASAISQPH